MHDLFSFCVGDLGSDCGSPVDVALGSFVWSERHVQEITRILNERGFPGRIMLGGPQVSYAEAGMLEVAYPYADIFVRGVLSCLVASWGWVQIDWS